MYAFKTLCPKITLLLIHMLFCSLVATAQTELTESVYLKNGSIIKGTIVEQIPNTSIKIKTKDGSLFVYTFDEIEKITKEEQVKQADKLEPINPTYTPSNNKGADSRSSSRDRGDRRYLLIIEYIKSVNTTNGLLADTAATAQDVFGSSTSMLRFVNGGQLNEYLSIGFGLGFEFATNKEKVSYTQIPLSFDIRAGFIPGVFSPVLGTSIGYSIGLDSIYKGGFHIHPTLGARLYFTKRFSIIANVGYKYQSMTRVINDYTYLNGPYSSLFSEKRRTDLRFTTFSLGVTF
jgi:hypothetical protein